MDILRKAFCANDPDQDIYTSALRYIKSTLILDVMATLPQMLS